MASLWENARATAGGAISGLGSVLHLPEYGISENVIGKPTPLAMQNLETQSAVLGAQKSQMSGNGQVLPATTGPTLNTTTPSASSLVGTSGGGGADISSIEAAYNQTVSDLNAQRGQTQSQYDIYGQQLGNQYNQTAGDIGAKQTETNAQLEASKGQVGASSQSAVQNARQAYNELQQRNQAYLSAGGISSSSAAEAMQEGLSRNTLQALNNITQNKDATLQNIATQQASVKDFYDRQVAALQQSKQTATDQLGLQLRTAMQQIDSQQGLATLQKQQAKNAAFSQASAASQAIAQQTAQAQASLDAFTNVKNQIFGAVSGYAGGTVSLADFNNAIAKTNDQLKASGVQVDTGAVLNSLSNPYAAATPTNYFTTTATSGGQLATVNGKQVWLDANGNVVKSY